MAPRTVSSLLTMLSDTKVTRAGKLVGGTTPADNLLMRGITLDFDSVKWFIEEIMDKYADLFTCNYHVMKDMHMFHLRHGLDWKWSIFLQACLEAMVHTIQGLDSETTVSDHTMTLMVPLNEA